MQFLVFFGCTPQGLVNIAQAWRLAPTLGGPMPRPNKLLTLLALALQPSCMIGSIA